MTVPTQSAFGQKKQILNKDQLSSIVLNLRNEVINNNQTSTIIGTGSFIVHKDIPYIVTAGHVAKSMNEKSYIIIKGQNDSSITIKIFDLYSKVNGLRKHRQALSLHNGNNFNNRRTRNTQKIPA